MNNLRTLLQKLCNSADDSLSQKLLFEQLLAYTISLLKYHCRLYSNGDDLLNLTLMGLSGLDRKNVRLNAKTIRDFMAKLSPSLSEQQIRERYRNLVVAIFNNKKVDLLRQEKPHLFCSLDNFLTENDSTSFLDFLGQEDRSLIEQEDQELKQVLWIYLAQDPDKLLINSFPKGYPQANLKVIVAHRYLLEPEESWKSLSERLETPLGTLTSHFHRIGKPLLRKIVNDFLGYAQLAS
jgi:hypothetical protein